MRMLQIAANGEEKGEPLARKAPVLRWYFGAIGMNRLLTAKVTAAAVASALLLDAVIPYCIALVVDRLGGVPSMQQILPPVSVLLVSFFLECGLVPYRLWNRRLLEVYGHEYLTGRINDAIRDNPELVSKLRHGSAVSATEKFLRTWDTLLFTVTEQLVTFVVGIVSLVVLLSLRAPLALTAVAFAIMVVGVAARKAAEKMSLTWGRRTRAETEESAGFDGLYSNSLMLWLVETLTLPRRVMTNRRSAAATEYARAAAVYYFFMYGIGSFLKVASVVGGAVMVVYGVISIGTLSLFVVYAFTLSERLYGIFGISEVFGNAAAESSHLLDSLEGGIKRSPLELQEGMNAVEFRGVCVEYVPTPSSTDDKEDSPPGKKVVVALPNVTLRPGIAVFTGPNGCGKSTRLKVMAGVQEYARGSVTLAGQEIRDADIRRHVFFGQQDFDKLSVAVKDLFGEHPDEVLCQQVFGYVGYKDVPIGRLLSELSGGQRRRVFLARLFYAVLTREKGTLAVLCLDEPTNDLDEDAIESLKKGLVELAEGDPLLIIALATHTREMKDVADQLVEV